MTKKALVLGLMFVGLSLPLSGAESREIGAVDINIHFLFPDDKLVAETFEDPDFKNVSCYISRSVLGGVKGGVGVADNGPNASISCIQVGPVDLEMDKVNTDGERVYKERRSLLFKDLYVERYIDVSKKALVYMLFTRKVLDGSLQNSISAVSIRPWYPQGI